MNENEEQDDGIVLSNEENKLDEKKSSFKFEPQKAFSGEIVERLNEPQPTASASAAEVKKPISKFKASKIKK